MTARRTLIENLDPRARDWMEQAIDESLRRQGRFRDLVLRMLAPNDEFKEEATRQR